MARTAEYKVLQENNATKLGAELNGLAAQGWQPILMTSVSSRPGVITTVILEHVLGS